MKCEICGQEKCKGNVNEVLEVVTNIKTDNWREEFRKKFNSRDWLEAYIQNLLDEQKREIIEEIEKLKQSVQEQTGSFKYNDQYDDCIKIISNLK